MTKEKCLPLGFFFSAKEQLEMGSKASILLQDSDIEEIQEETGCLYC